MELVVLAALMLGSFALAFTAAKGMLAIIFHVMIHGRLPVTVYWRPLIFVVALFWLWYLAPASAQSAFILFGP
jgi:hypothetical protein